MPIWEYKIITSGTLGFASPQLLEQHLNQLGKEEWEIIHFQTRPDNPLAFYGLARRSVGRDWSAEPAAAAAFPGWKPGAVPAPPEEKTVAAPDADQLRAEAEQRRESLLAREESLRPLHDDRAEAGDDAPAGQEEWDESEAPAEDEDLPTFFEAIRPHMRRNQRGPGMAASVEYLAKKFGQTEADLLEALKECGFTLPSGPKDPPIYLEYDGDLFWLNFNSRRQLWINTREKPRAAFKPAPGKPVATAEVSETGDRQPERTSEQNEQEGGSSARAGSRDPKSEMPAEPLPAGPALLDRLRPMMRRNRRDSGLSGSVSYLARALKTPPATLEAAFTALGLVLPPGPGDRPVFLEIGDLVYWLNQDKSGQIWINARQNERGDAAGAEAAAETTDRGPAGIPPIIPQTELRLDGAAAAAPAAAAPASPLAAVRLLLKETKRGGAAAKVNHIAKQLHKSVEALLAALVGAGLKVPEKAREKPVFVEHAGEILWLNRNARDELWLNAKASKFAAAAADEEDSAGAPTQDDAAAGTRVRRPRKKKEETAG